MKMRAGELTGADAVRGVPEGVQEQLEQLKVGYSLIKNLIFECNVNVWGNGH